MPEKRKVFAAVKGHAFDRNAFEAMLRACGAEPTIVDQPAASTMIANGLVDDYDAVVLHDMWGLDFRAPREARPAPIEPDTALVRGWGRLLEKGIGVIALHHAIASWPSWEGYAQMLGGRFLYRDAVLGGTLRQDSGYLPDARYEAAVADHPVTQGLPPRFALDDELYAMEYLDAPGTEPLLTLASEIENSRFISAKNAVRRIDGAAWSPPSRSPLLGWAKTAGNSRVVYLQPGDSAATFEDPNYRTLVTNALAWTTALARQPPST